LEDAARVEAAAVERKAREMAKAAAPNEKK
jgi:hypothetical protein